MIKKLLTFCYWSDPAVFRKAEEGGFWVSFPDLPECMTQGDSMNEAYEMAVDALGLSLSSMEDEYYGAAEPPVRCGESHLSGLTEPPHFIY